MRLFFDIFIESELGSNSKKTLSDRNRGNLRRVEAKKKRLEGRS